MTKNYAFIFGLLAVLFLSSSCDNEEEPCADGFWEYEEVDTWAECFPDCGGSVQSPIDIVGAVGDTTLMGLDLSYSTSSIDLKNNGHTVQFNYATGSKLTLNGVEYILKQLHFHTTSEHTVDGQHYDMEIHLVHEDAGTGNLAVVGLLATEGTENAFLANFFNDLPLLDETFTDPTTTVDVNDLLPTNTSYYTYQGSLTTPPCSEIATWFVMSTPIEVSSAQIQSMQDRVVDNYRPTQPLNGREIRLFN